MIKRIVMMEFLPGTEILFLKKFENVRKEIRSQPGCQGLELLRSSEKEENSYWTISFWQSADDLETYRASSLFQGTWKDIKPMFAARPRAWTLTSIEIVS